MDGSNELISNVSETETVFQKRARYYSPANIFTVKRPPVPKHVFTDEIEQAMANDAPTGWIALDAGARMGFDYPATTPMLLGRYATVRAGDSLTGQFQSSDELYYVIAGAGSAAKADEVIDWAVGDIFALPGGGETELTGGVEGGVLFSRSPTSPSSPSTASPHRIRERRRPRRYTIPMSKFGAGWRWCMTCKNPTPTRQAWPCIFPASSVRNWETSIRRSRLQ
jgi:hypothetical protein